MNKSALEMDDLDTISAKAREMLNSLSMMQEKHDAMKEIFRYSLDSSTTWWTLYCSPVLGGLSLLCFACLLMIGIGDKNTASTFFLLIAQALFELLYIIIPPIVIVAVYLSGDKYIEYQYCEVTRAFMVFIPASCFCLSQWLKVLITMQRFVMFYSPLKAKALFTKKRLFVTCAVLFIVSVPTVIVTLYDVKFVKVAYIDEETSSLEYQCYDVYSPLLGEYRKLILAFFASYGPFLLMVIFSTGLSYQIKKRRAIRQRLRKNQPQNADMDNLSRAVHFTTISFIILLLPHLVIDGFRLYQWFNDISSEESYKTFFLVMNTLDMVVGITHFVTIPVTILIFFCLSRQVRQTMFLKVQRALSVTHSRRSKKDSDP